MHVCTVYLTYHTPLERETAANDDLLNMDDYSLMRNSYLVRGN